MVGYRILKGGRKGNAWWTQEIKEAVEDKKRAYKRMLQKNISEGISERRTSEYNSWNIKVTDLVNESKRKVDEEFGRKLSETFFEDKKLFWEEVKKRGEECGE